ncbi:5-formyltetrahydrofolate cyclo-ligase [Paracoccus sp. Z118]|uniref:5-formyltetrahydrofolate cyclo-ligase n=1 Tax=Paracoccus sp. Z118 TaxID=2851017 RepID=UPI001C2C08C7|nr:5-formyltetrahydrofolate cyclo-ligase [Paracoccus sp. Z118]MBV0893013.1 5-formyltetrahydrofolate cyclo-ligase [Paracoccus sp. Z118]
MGAAVTDKAAMRARAMAARARGGDQMALDARLTAALAPFAGRVLAGYWPMRGEADPRPAMAAHDGPLCLPVVVAPATPLIFRRFADELEPGAFGTSHPPETAELMVPQVLIVPLVGFDRQGHRLGYGGGFYDRTLAQLRAGGGRVVAIGLAWAGQELAGIPAEPTDERLEAIVTDAETLKF